MSDNMINSIIKDYTTAYKCRNVGAYFVSFLDGNPPKLYKGYANALKAYRKAGGYGHASIVPKADALNHLATLIS
jgi:hypothetical protein